MSYNSQFVTTYSFYDKSLYLNNPISSRYSYEKEKKFKINNLLNPFLIYIKNDTISDYDVEDIKDFL